jgi:hypothetical protein
MRQVADEVELAVHVASDRRAGLEVDLDRLAELAAARLVDLDAVVAEDDERSRPGQLAGGAAPRPVQRLVGGETDVEARVADDPTLRANRLFRDDVGGVAVSRFRSAFEIAESLGLRMPQLRAATRLTRLRRAARKRPDWSDVLRDVYETFTEGFETPDLVEARAVFDEVDARVM